MTEKAETWGERQEGEGIAVESAGQLTPSGPLSRPATCDLRPAETQPLRGHFSLSCSGDACFYASLRTSDAWAGLSTVAAASHLGGIKLKFNIQLLNHPSRVLSDHLAPGTGGYWASLSL